MRDIVSATRCPDDEQRHPFKNTDALKSDFSVSLTHIFHREQLTVEKPVQIVQVDAVVSQIPETLVLVPGDHGVYCICNCIYTQVSGGLGVELGFCIGPACLARA